MSIEIIKTKGVYLGFCQEKGYVYSIRRSAEITKEGIIEKYMIVSLLNGVSTVLIEYAVPFHV